MKLNRTKLLNIASDMGLIIADGATKQTITKAILAAQEV